MHCCEQDVVAVAHCPKATGDVVEETGPQIFVPGGVVDAEAGVRQSAGELNLEGGRMARSQTGDTVFSSDGDGVGTVGAATDLDIDGSGDGI